MVHIDDDFPDPGSLKIFYVALQKAFPVYLRKRFGVPVCPWLKSGAQACGEDHRAGDARL
jgi:hypothetical protein